MEMGQQENNGDDRRLVVLVGQRTEVEVLAYSYTRSDVLNKLYQYQSNVAAAFGPYSDEVEGLQDDITFVKEGGDIGSFEWVFPGLDEQVESFKEKWGSDGAGSEQQ